MAWGSSYFPKSMTVGERKAKAERAAARLGRKQSLDPVVIEGALATTWWGKAWNQNLESYADFSNRLPRGRSYAKHGSVIDLRLEPGRVAALVQGSQSSPYEIRIDIDRITPKDRKALVQACAGKLASAEALLAGRFPPEMESLLKGSTTGLFPKPKEIKLSCSCPDWADLCKHVAAALYGVGARLDRDPALFFTLRDVPLEDLVAQSVRQETDRLLGSTGKGESSRLDLAGGDLESLFGVDLSTSGKKVAKASRKEGGEKVKVRKAKPPLKETPAGKKRKKVETKVPAKAIGRALRGIAASLKKIRGSLEDLDRG